MFGPSSRYFAVPDGRHLEADGSWTVHKKRRFLPQPQPRPGDRAAQVGVGERLDVLAARIFGDPLQQWRIADLNLAMNPHHLAESGRWLHIPAPGFRGGGPS